MDSPDAVTSLFDGAAVEAPAVNLGRTPTRKLVVVTCMDARIDVLGALGLDIGEAHVVRNAGAAITEDVLRSIQVSQTLMNTEDVLVLGHSSCGAYGSAEETKEALRKSLSQIPRGRVAAAYYDLQGGRLEPITSRT